MLFTRRILDVIINTAPQLINLFAGLLSTIIIAKELGPSGLGEYTLAMSIISLLILISDFGLNQSTIKFASKLYSTGHIKKYKEIIRNSLKIRLLLALLSSSFTLIILNIFEFRTLNDKTIKALTIYVLPIALTSVFLNNLTIFFQSTGQHVKYSKIQVLQKLILLLGVYFTLHLNSINSESLIFVNFLTQLACILLFIKFLPKGTLWDNKDFKNSSNSRFENIKKSLGFDFFKSELTPFVTYYALTTIVSVLMLQYETWVIAYNLGAEALGTYNIASRFTLPITVIYNSIIFVFWPYMASIGDLQKFKIIINKAYLLFIFILLSCIVYALSVPILNELIFNEIYQSSNLIAQILVFKSGISIIHGICSIISYNINLVKIVFRITVIQLVLFIIFNYLFINSYGVMCTAVSILIIEIFAVFSSLYTVRSALKNS